MTLREFFKKDCLQIDIVQDWTLPMENETFTKSDTKNGLFYIVALRRWRFQYLKVGTTLRTIRERFNSQDYKNGYSSIKFLYVCELKCRNKRKRPLDACSQVEDLTRSAIRAMGGFTFVPNDRFFYFQLPTELPVVTSFTTGKVISLR